MRAAPRTKRTKEEQRAAQLASSRAYYQRHVIANLAAGLTSDGEPRRRNFRLSPQMQARVQAYQRRQQREARAAHLTPLESAWRSERASMGPIHVPEPMVALRWEDEP